MMYGDQGQNGGQNAYPTDATASGGQSYPGEMYQGSVNQPQASPYAAYQQTYPPTPQVVYQNSGMQQPVDPMSGMNPVMGNSGMNPVMGNSGMNPVMGNSGMNPVMSNSGMNPVMGNSGMQQPYQPTNNYPYQVEGQPVDPNRVPQRVKPPRREIDMESIVRPFIIVGLPVMMVLFLVCMVLGNILWLKWAFIGFALCMGGIMWLNNQMFQRDMVLTFTVVLAALTLVCTVSALTTPATVQGGSVITATPGPGQQLAIGLDGSMYSPADVVETPAMWAQVTPTPAGSTAQDSGLNSQAVVRMTSFLHYWAVNQTDKCVELCLPSWVQTQRAAAKKKNEDTSTAAEKALYQIQAGRTPVEYTATAISGTDNDITRTVTVSMSVDRNKSTSRYIFKIVMTKEDDQWYVDPRSLESNVKATATPVSAEATQPPTPAPNADANTILYYNPDGGSLYHITSTCKSTNSKYLPFKGQFTYGQLNESPYSSLTPCSMCGAPLRPKN